MSEPGTPAEYDLRGQVAIVTGGGRGLGRAFAQELAKAGALVSVTARTKSQVDETARMIKESGGDALAFEADVTDAGAAARVVKETERLFGPVDILVNNAASLYVSSVMESDVDEWWQLMNTNVRGPLIWAKTVLPGMVARGRGRIINVSSIAAHWAVPHVSAYCSSKAALSHFTRCLAAEVRQQGVTVLAFAPSARTELASGLSAEGTTMSPELRAQFKKSFNSDVDDRMNWSVDTFMFLASGAGDELAGRHISSLDSPGELRMRLSDIVQKDEYTIRREPPLPTKAQRSALYSASR